VEETERCLEAGLILAALQVATAMLELLVRETLAQDRMANTPKVPDEDLNALAYRLVKELEEDRRLSFHRMVCELRGGSAFSLSREEADLLTTTYTATRNQLHHGIVGRFVRDRSPSDLRPFIESTGLAHFSDAEDFAKIIKTQGVAELAKVLDAVEVVVAKGAV